MISYFTKHPIDLRASYGHAPNPLRSPGYHLGSLVRGAALEAGHLKGYEEDDLDILIRETERSKVGDSGTLTRIMIGFAWEHYIASQLIGQDRSTFVYQPGETSCQAGDDLIFCTPDGMHFDPITGDPILDEIKATFKTAKRPVVDDVPWMWQTAGYLYTLSMETGVKWLRVEFHPLYLRGDYSGINPLYLPQMVEFEWQELVSIWNTLVKVKNSGKIKPEKGS